MKLLQTYNRCILSLWNRKKQLPRICGLVLIFLVVSCSAGWATNYYISPTGSDSNNGLSENAPIATFTRSYTLLSPGDTLILLDGTYNQQIRPTVSGAPGQPITFQAQNRGKAIIQMTSDGNAILVYSTTSVTYSYLTFDGLIARSKGEYSTIRIASSDNVTETQMTNHITVKNTGAFGSANLRNVVNIDIGNNARDCLFEDVWAYGFGRKALQAFGCLRITVRRAVLRYDYWDGSGYKPNDPRVTFSGYNTQDSIFENIIAIDSAPNPPGTSPDRASFVASGNETPAVISGSARNKYYGMLSLNNYGSGLEVNGGTGDPTEDLEFKDLILWKCQYYGVNIQANDNGSSFSYSTIGNNGISGFRMNPSPSYPITNEVLTNNFSINNGGSGYYYSADKISLFQNNTGIGNTDSDIESAYAPTLNYLVRPEQVNGYERGATMVNRYVNGVLTNTPLWPWPNEDLIKETMCNPADLATVHRISANGPGWEPGWVTSGKSLTRYIWEYLGNQIPDDIYAAVPKITTIKIQ